MHFLSDSEVVLSSARTTNSYHHGFQEKMNGTWEMAAVVFARSYGSCTELLVLGS